MARSYDFEACIAFLIKSDAHKRRHSGRFLLDHLKGVFDLLRSSTVSEAVCYGGLFHSVYGTNSYKEVSLGESNRVDVKALIGDEAESLAWDFCGLDRPKAFTNYMNGSGPVLIQITF